MSASRAAFVLSGLLCGMIVVAAPMYYFFGMTGVYIAPLVHLAICCLVTPVLEGLMARLK